MIRETIIKLIYKLEKLDSFDRERTRMLAKLVTPKQTGSYLTIKWKVKD